MPNFRHQSIAETLADKDSRHAFALATGYELPELDTEKTMRRARYLRRKGGNK